MSVILNLLTNSKLPDAGRRKHIISISKKLNELRLPASSMENRFSQWDFQIEKENKEEETLYNVSFEGHSSIFPTLYATVGIISTLYRYGYLYKNKQLEWFEKFRNELFLIVKSIGGTEVIYVADNLYDKLTGYFYMALDNEPYEIIKEKMIKEMGEPVRDYSKLNYESFDSQNINEFFLDDFSDLKK